MLTHTYWEEGKRLVHDVTGAPIRASDVTIGSAVHVMPEGIGELPSCSCACTPTS